MSRPTRAGTQKTRASATAGLLSEDNVREYVLSKAESMAPADVDTLLSRAPEVRRKARDAERQSDLFRLQVEVALRLLDDHVSRDSAQIPYFTVALLAGALFYFLEPVDAIPDFVPGAGMDDDAMVLLMAYRLGADGIQRYCTCKDIAPELVLPPITTPRPR